MIGVVTVALGRVPEWIICTGLSNRMLAGRMSMPARLCFVAPVNEPGSVAVVSGDRRRDAAQPTFFCFFSFSRYCTLERRVNVLLGTPEFLLNSPSVGPLTRICPLKLHPDVQTHRRCAKTHFRTPT